MSLPFVLAVSAVVGQASPEFPNPSELLSPTPAMRTFFELARRESPTAELVDAACRDLLGDRLSGADWIVSSATSGGFDHAHRVCESLGRIRDSEAEPLAVAAEWALERLARSDNVAARFGVQRALRGEIRDPNRWLAESLLGRRGFRVIVSVELVEAEYPLERRCSSFFKYVVHEHRPRFVRSVEWLPKGRLRLEAVTIPDGSTLTDREVLAMKNCPYLKEIGVWGSPASRSQLDEIRATNPDIAVIPAVDQENELGPVTSTLRWRSGGIR